MTLDIEKEGFVFKYTEEGSHNVAYTKPHPTRPLMVDVIYNDKSNWVLIAFGAESIPWAHWKTVFAGQIHTQEDFVKVLSMVL
jgi:hypothetical protein